MTATPAASAASPGAEPCAPLHSASVDYRAGDTVSHHGRNWTAKWWSRNENPGAGSAWSDRGACTGGVSDFVISPERFDEIFPDRHPFYTYQGLIDALHAYPRFANTGTPQTRARRRPPS